MVKEKTIDTLVEDIYGVLKDGITESVDDGSIDRFGHALAGVIRSRLVREPREPTLRMSNIGQPCNRKLWYELNQPESKEELRPEVYLKFLYGDILEELLLFLAELAGHRVEGRQDEQEIEGIKGHRDAVVDGVVTDVKSASSYSFDKFESHGLEKSDPFGYVDQIQSYLHSGQDDPVVTDKDRAAFLAVDKTLGKVCLDVHPRRKSPPMDAIVRYKKDVVSREEPPARAFDPEPDGKSGNMKLGMNCSYCDFKQVCHPGLRTFLYSNGPRFLTEVKRVPDVQEIT